MTHPHLNFNGGLIKPPLKVGQPLMSRSISHNLTYSMMIIPRYKSENKFTKALDISASRVSCGVPFLVVCICLNIIICHTLNWEYKQAHRSMTPKSFTPTAPSSILIWLKEYHSPRSGFGKLHADASAQEWAPMSVGKSQITGTFWSLLLILRLNLRHQNVSNDKNMRWLCYSPRVLYVAPWNIISIWHVNDS